MSEIHSASPLTKLKDLAPHEVLEFLAQILRLFPPEFQHRVKTIIDTLPATGDNMQKILEVVRAQWKGIQSQDRLQIAIVGASQTGKTTLLNAIEEGQSPGSPTIFSVVETPGLEEFLGFRNSRRLPDELEQADLVLLLLDSRYDVSEQTHKLVRRLKGLGKPLLVALNKCDLISNHSEAAKKAQKTLGERTVAVSAFRTRTLEQLFGPWSLLTPQPSTLLPAVSPDFARRSVTVLRLRRLLVPAWSERFPSLSVISFLLRPFKPAWC